MDEDDDGYTDCADDDCVGKAACSPVTVTRAWVNGGSLENRIRKVRRYNDSWSGPCGNAGYGDTTESRDARRLTDSGVARSVTGSVQVHLASTSGVETCHWRVDEAQVWRTSYFRSAQFYKLTWSPAGEDRSCLDLGTTSKGGSSETLTRTGFSVESGCGLAGSSFLPATLQPSKHSLDHVYWETNAGARWYGGRSTFESFTSRGASGTDTSTETAGHVLSTGASYETSR